MLLENILKTDDTTFKYDTVLQICMGLGNLFVQVFLTYYTKYVFSMIWSKTGRKNIKETNKKLDVLRKVPIKTVDQQKEFINLRYPKKGPFKWKWGIIPSFVWNIFLFVLILRGYMYVFNYLKLDVKIWQGVLFIIVFPIIFNIVMTKFGLQKSDIRIYLRGWFK